MGLLRQKEDLKGSGDGNDYHGNNTTDKDLNCSTDGNQIYYSVFIPNLTEDSSDEPLIPVYENRADALKTLKAYKKARLKVFTDEKAAIDFSINGSEAITKVECPNLPSSPVVNHSESLTFKGPKSQDLVKFRKAIEKHDFAYVAQYVEENPRYLISSGDTPQILQEGSRYNALHVAAKANNAQVAKFVCEKVKSVEFMNKLYGGAKSNLADRGSIMLDLYLNTPDKASNETPLHFASKLGALEVVRVLVAYEQCDRRRENKYGETAKDVVCSRLTSSAGMSAESSGLKKDILFALEDHYYVAVLRSPDNAIAPTIPDPFSPTNPLSCLRGEFSTPTKHTDVNLPLVVTGVAGPMTASDATTFRKKWKTPPRKLVFDPQAASPIKTDPDKGFERVGRALASDFKVQWKEYWDFLGEFVDLSSTEGLTKLEVHLNKSIDRSPPSMIESPERLTTVSNQSVVSPVTDLCNNFKTLSIVDDRPKVSPNCLDHSSAVFATRIALCLRQGASHALKEIDRYQDFLNGCSRDMRFSREDLTTAHSRLAALVYSKLSGSLKNKSCHDLVRSVLNDNMDSSSQSVNNLKCVLNFVLRNNDGLVISSCDCALQKNGDTQNKFVFCDEPQKCARNLNFSYSEKDLLNNSDDDDEFFTPPASPFNGNVEDDDFLAACDSFEIFITGGVHPTKTDFDVYRSIGDILPNISPTEYPMVYLWSLSISKYLQHVNE